MSKIDLYCRDVCGKETRHLAKDNNYETHVQQIIIKKVDDEQHQIHTNVLSDVCKECNEKILKFIEKMSN